MSLKFAVVIILMVLVAMIHCMSRHEELIEAQYQHIPGLGYYKFYNNASLWKDAQSTCLQEGGQLIIINSEDEAKAIVNLFPEVSEAMNLLAGFHDQFTEGVHVTTTGILLNHTGYTKFFLDNTGDDNEDCGTVYSKTGELEYVQCNSAHKFICEQQLWVDYEYYMDIGYYKLHTDGMTWTNAYETCKKEGAHLAVINSKNETTLITQMLEHHPNIPNVDDDSIVLVGFSMVYDTSIANSSTKEYLTVQGQSLERAGFFTWTSGQPTPGTENHCGAFTRNGTLFMANCSSHYAFVCEHEI